MYYNPTDKMATCSPFYLSLQSPQNVVPDPDFNCGPYTPANHLHLNGKDMDHAAREAATSLRSRPEYHAHDTIGMVVVDENGSMAAGASTNGAQFKVPG